MISKPDTMKEADFREQLEARIEGVTGINGEFPWSEISTKDLIKLAEAMNIKCSYF